MKRPILQFKNVCASPDGAKTLRHASFTLYEGEYVAIVGADGSGKMNVPLLLSGGACKKTGGEILLNGKPFAPQSIRDAQRKRVFCTTNRTHLLDELTIYENFSLNHALTQPFRLVNERLIAHEAQSALDRFGVRLDARERVSALTPSQKSVVELIKFHMLGARLVVMMFVTAQSTPAEDALFLNTVRRMTGEGVTVLLLANQYMHVLSDVDRLYLLSAQGRIARELGPGAFSAQGIGAYLAGGAPVRARIEPRAVPGRPVLSARDLCTEDQRGVNLTLYPGQILGLYYRDGRRRDSVPLALGGAARYTGQLYVDGEPVTFKCERDAFRLGLALMPSSPKQLYFPDLSVEENIEQPFLPRVGGRLGVLKGGLLSALKQDGRKHMDELTDEFSLSGYNDCIFPVLTRFMLYPFRVIIMLHPSIVNDAVKTEMLFKLMEQASRRGCALIVASTRLDELKAVCSDIYTME